jgi:hypothetical protein
MSSKIMGTIKMDEVHNIVAEQNGWGQLENGTWINLKFTVPYSNSQKVTEVEEAEEPETDFVTGMSAVGEVDSEESATESASTNEALTESYMNLMGYKFITPQE